jgi:hypothetical protein
MKTPILAMRRKKPGNSRGFSLLLEAREWLFIPEKACFQVKTSISWVFDFENWNLLEPDFRPFTTSLSTVRPLVLRPRRRPRS